MPKKRKEELEEELEAEDTEEEVDEDEEEVEEDEEEYEEEAEYEEEEEEYEEEEEDEEEESARRFRAVPALVLTLAVAGFSALAWYAYRSGDQPVDERELLVVEADPEPVKERPEDPGGMQFPHQDKTVFENISPAARPAPVERVLPGAEEPQPEALASVAESAPAETGNWVNERLQQQPADPAALSAQSPSAGGRAPDPAPAEEETVAAAETMEIKEVPVEPVKEAKPEPKQETAPAPEKKPEPAKAASAAGAAGVIQLGAYSSEDEAKKAWGTLSKKFSTPLSGGKPSYQRADLGAKGVFIRLRVSVSDAKATCAKLAAQKQPCMVVSGK